MSNHCTISDIKKLYLLFCVNYGHKFNSFHTPEIITLWYKEWWEALLGIDKLLIFKAFDILKIINNWPFSLAEIIQCCDDQLGLPNPYEAAQLIVSKNFSHPILEEIYQSIGDYSFRNDSEKELMKKIKTFYPKVLGEFRIERQRKAYFLEHNLKQVAKDVNQEVNQEVTHESHGSEARRDHVRTDNMRKVENYLF